MNTEAPKPWVGSLSPSELLALTHIGIEPAGQVYGISVQAMWTGNLPVTTLEIEGERDGFNQALTECMFLMNAQADELGANGVLECQVKYEIDMALAGPSYITFKLEITGTAVKDRSSISSSRYFATISCGEMIAMRKAGYEPCGLAIGNCSYHQVAWRQQIQVGAFGFWANQEITELTQGPYTAREIASNRMVQMARASGGTGIVGVDVRSSVYPSGSLAGGTMAALCRMLLIGSAIRRNPNADSKVDFKTNLSIGQN
ncbi:MAG: hypothetical protein P4L46_13885 [Fimbriimonas sp.]|nr:hypothetical protein [Fimbriimonas sp.]